MTDKAGDTQTTKTHLENLIAPAPQLTPVPKTVEKPSETPVEKDLAARLAVVRGRPS